MKDLSSHKYIVLTIILSILINVHVSFAQINANLVASNGSINQCGPVTLTVLVSGGSGNYTYGWSADPPSGATIEDRPSITVTPSAVTNFRCIVFDLVTGAASFTQLTVAPDLVGDFDVFVPNAISPNGDGLNDVWMLGDADRGFGPINAFRYEATIVDRDGRTIFSRNRTVSSGTTGLQGGEVIWDGRVNGSLVPDGVYFYALTLFNCNNNRSFSGSFTILGGSDNIISILPNPSKDFVEISINDKNNSFMKSEFVPYKLTIYDKLGNTVRSETIPNPKHKIDVSDLLLDMYYLVGEYNGEPFEKKLILKD